MGELNPQHGISTEIVNIGDELLSGDVINTNAAFLSDRCRKLGFVVERAHVVRDRVEEIVAVLRDVASRAKVCLVSGGLGPTTDDRTTAAVALAMGVGLHLDASALERLEEKFRQRSRSMPAANRKQAEFPEGASILANIMGTAEGFVVELAGCHIAVLPGVPRELEAMMVEVVEPRLRQVFGSFEVPRRVYRTLGRGESSIAQSVEPLIEAARARGPGLAATYVHYRASMPEVQVILEATPDARGQRATADELATLDPEIFAALSPAIYGVGTAPLAQRVVSALSKAGLQLSTAESCTGGGVGRAITAIAGSSACFAGGIVAYHNRVKTEVLGVPESMLAEHGAVSETVAYAMADGARRTTGSDLAVAVTGIAGPEGGSTKKPVGTVHVAVTDGSIALHEHLQLWGARHTIQRAAEGWALKLVWTYLAARGLATISCMDAE